MTKVRMKGGAPMFDQNNLNNIGEIQAFIKRQYYVKGFSQGVVTGQNSNINIALGGTCRWFYGFNIFVTNARIADDDTFSLNLNRELIVDTANWKSFYPAQTGNINKKWEFYVLQRPLSGSDSLQLSWTAANNKDVFFQFYLSNMPPSELSQPLT